MRLKLDISDASDQRLSYRHTTVLQTAATTGKSWTVGLHSAALRGRTIKPSNQSTTKLGNHDKLTAEKLMTQSINPTPITTRDEAIAVLQATDIASSKHNRCPRR